MPMAALSDIHYRLLRAARALSKDHPNNEALDSDVGKAIGLHGSDDIDQYRRLVHDLEDYNYLTAGWTNFGAGEVQITEEGIRAAEE
jgi:hypothetical protein